jgi:hypothetical protein
LFWRKDWGRSLRVLLPGVAERIEAFWEIRLKTRHNSKALTITIIFHLCLLHKIKFLERLSGRCPIIFRASSRGFFAWQVSTAQLSQRQDYKTPFLNSKTNSSAVFRGYEVSLNSL